MKKSVLIAAALAAMFPYTQLIASDSYTQPYALFLALLAVPFCAHIYIKYAAGWDVFLLIGLALLGIFFFLFSCLPSPTPQDYKSLLMYTSPIIFSITAYNLYRSYPDTLRKIANTAAAIWLLVGIIQSGIDPSFATRWVGDWSGAAEVVVLSGRGVLGLAPEPTHHGFHLLLMAATLYLIGGNRYLILGCVIAALLIARSSSVLLAMLLGGCLCIIMQPKKSLIPVLTLVFSLIGVTELFGDRFVFEGIRILSLISSAAENPTSILMIDNSVNLRIGGLLVGAELVRDGWFLPHGISNADWLTRIPQIRAANPWLFDISAAGIPSGLLIIVYQLGLFGLILVSAPIYRIVSSTRSFFGLWLILSALAVFLGQYLISAPAFGFMHGLSLAISNPLRKRKNEYENLLEHTKR